MTLAEPPEVWRMGNWGPNVLNLLLSARRLLAAKAIMSMRYIPWTIVGFLRARDDKLIATQQALFQ